MDNLAFAPPLFVWSTVASCFSAGKQPFLSDPSDGQKVLNRKSVNTADDVDPDSCGTAARRFARFVTEPEATTG
jgi:hypothetical protein